MEIYRCHVNDVDRALPFYRALGFRLVDRVGRPFAVVQRSRMVVWLCACPGAGRTGGRGNPALVNRLVLEVQDLALVRNRLRLSGGTSGPQDATGSGGLEALWLDPAGNPVELFQPLRGPAEPSAPAPDRDPQPTG